MGVKVGDVLSKSVWRGMAGAAGELTTCVLGRTSCEPEGDSVVRNISEFSLMPIWSFSFTCRLLRNIHSVDGRVCLLPVSVVSPMEARYLLYRVCDWFPASAPSPHRGSGAQPPVTGGSCGRVGRAGALSPAPVDRLSPWCAKCVSVRIRVKTGSSVCPFYLMWLFMLPFFFDSWSSPYS